ncbi:nucleoside 2-deoxyribosyltransferase [Virgibacillus sp. 179-BFC.A HS]|uniref:Nucleoside 2-deoxyribosyltransferase n=1 Tax=Tigheibacillus jepli TaxID=3035914 RepID=A0ABU5CJ64_9BACI|nr:nucleoside 2-deoxyribosyltransferase [Virgibacillus sp. 179-BFC.A HS]MDY0406386.1 nucleoside 2-deoxyribosyltransferase [Virgibacillus sp. 179-BFC.A HS]
MKENKVKVYLASPFFNDEQIERVERVEKALDANPAIGEYFSPRKNQLEHLTFGSKEWAAAIYQKDIEHVQWADVIVAVLDYEGETELHGVRHGHVDSGTAFEVGYAIAANKPVVLVHEKGGIVNLMLSQSCQAYLDNVEAIKDYDFNTMPKIEFEGEVM